MGIALNLLFVVVEVVAAFYLNSLALLSDAGHNLADVAGLVLSVLALKLAKLKPSAKFTYGYKKTTVLAALLNAVFLLVSVGAIGYEAIQKFIHPSPVQGIPIAGVASIGIVINFVSALLFRDDKKELNAHSAYLHLLADALVSLGVVIGGLLIAYTGYWWIDPLLSLAIAVVILLGTFGLLKSSLKLTLDAVPESINAELITKTILEVKDVIDIHHLHIWALSSSQNALTAHIVVAENYTLRDAEMLRHRIKHALAEHDIHHATLEVEGKHAHRDKEDEGESLDCE